MNFPPMRDGSTASGTRCTGCASWCSPPRWAASSSLFTFSPGASDGFRGDGGFRLAENRQQDGDGGQRTHQQQRAGCSLPGIGFQLIGEQQSHAGTEGGAGAGDHTNLGKGQKSRFHGCLQGELDAGAESEGTFIRREGGVNPELRTIDY